MLAIGVIASRISRLQHVSTPAGRFRMIEEPDRAFDRRGAQVHVPVTPPLRPLDTQLSFAEIDIAPFERDHLTGRLPKHTCESPGPVPAPVLER